MKEKLIMCSSVTYAIKGKDLLKRKGFKAYVKRPSGRGCGCGYCIVVREEEADEALKILQDADIKLSNAKTD